jgi:uncharacterized membrane protein
MVAFYYTAFLIAFPSSSGVTPFPIFTLIAAFLRWGAPGAIYLLVGGVLYLVGTFLVTAAVKPGSPEGARVWADYLTNWSVWNHVRTGAALAETASFILASVIRSAQ